MCGLSLYSAVTSCLQTGQYYKLTLINSPWSNDSALYTNPNVSLDFVAALVLFLSFFSNVHGFIICSYTNLQPLPVFGELASYSEISI